MVVVDVVEAPELDGGHYEEGKRHGGPLCLEPTNQPTTHHQSTLCNVNKYKSYSGPKPRVPIVGVMRIGRGLGWGA